MNKTFIKENKSVIREFIGSVIASFFANKGTKTIDRIINKSPELKQKRDRITKLGDDIRNQLKKMKTTDPEGYKELSKRYGRV